MLRLWRSDPSFNIFTPAIIGNKFIFMKKTLLSAFIGASCLAPAAYAGLTVGDITLPQNVEYGQTASLKVAVENDGDEVADYKVEVYRTFTAFDKNYKAKNFATELLATVEGQDALAAGSNEIEVPVTFELGGSYDLLVKVIVGEEATQRYASEVLEVAGPATESGYTKTFPSSDIPDEVLGRTNELSGPNGDQFLGEQCIYPANLNDFPRNAIINSLTYYYRPAEGIIPPRVRYRVYLGTVDENTTTYSSGAFLAEDMVLVYDNICPEFVAVTGDPEEYPDQEWVLPLGRPFEYDCTKNLVITIEADFSKTFETNGFPWFIVERRYQDGSTEDRELCNVCSNWWKAGGVFSTAPERIWRGNMMPKVTLGYKLVKEAEVVDMAVGEVTVPEDVKAGDPASFRVEVSNVGTSDVEEFTLELLDVSEGIENAVVLVSQTIEETYGASSEGSEKIRYTFENEGEYKLAIRLTAAEDIAEENNITEEFELHVGPRVGVQVVDADSQKLRYADGIVYVGIGNAVSLSVNAADGRTVLSEVLDGEGEVVTSLPMGVYVARVADKDGKAYIAKFIVK